VLAGRPVARENAGYKQGVAHGRSRDNRPPVISRPTCLRTSGDNRRAETVPAPFILVCNGTAVYLLFNGVLGGKQPVGRLAGGFTIPPATSCGPYGLGGYSPAANVTGAYHV
jgi:hypothetical protein